MLFPCFIWIHPEKVRLKKLSKIKKSILTSLLRLAVMIMTKMEFVEKWLIEKSALAIFSDEHTT